MQTHILFVSAEGGEPKNAVASYGDEQQHQHRT